MGRATLGAILGVVFTFLTVVVLLLCGMVWYLANPESAAQQFPFVAKIAPDTAAEPKPLTPAADAIPLSAHAPYIQDGNVQNVAGVTGLVPELLPLFQTDSASPFEFHASSKQPAYSSGTDHFFVFPDDTSLSETTKIHFKTTDSGSASLKLFDSGNQDIDLASVPNQYYNPDKSLAFGTYTVKNNATPIAKFHILESPKVTSLDVKQADSTLSNIPGATLNHDGPQVEMTLEAVVTDGPDWELRVLRNGDDIKVISTTDQTNKSLKSFTLEQAGSYEFQVFYKGIKESPFTGSRTLLISPKSAANAFKPDLKSISIKPQGVTEFSFGQTLSSLADNNFKLPSAELMFSKSATIDRPLIVTVDATNAKKVDSLPTTEAGPVFLLATDSVTLTGIPVGTNSVVVKDRWSEQAFPGISVEIPQSGKIDPPAILAYSNNYADPTLLPIENNSVQVFGGYVQLMGRGPTNQNVELQVFKTENAILSFETSTVVKTDSKGYWNTTLSLETPYKGNRKIVAIGQSMGTHAYSAPLTLTGIQNDISTKKIAGLVLKDVKDTTISATNGIYRIASSEFSISSPPSDIYPLEARLVAIVNGNQHAVSGKTVGGTDQYSLSLSGLPSEETNEIRLAYVLGNEQSAPTTIRVVIDSLGPEIVKVIPDNFGTASGQTTLTLQFNKALNTTHAQEKLNYLLISRRGQGAKISPVSADYRPESKTVGLSFMGSVPPLLADEYELRINSRQVNPSPLFGITNSNPGQKIANAGIIDIFGNPLGKTAATPNGVDYSQVLNGTGDAPPNSAAASRNVLTALTREEPDLLTQRVGLPKTTGEPVVFPEFTSPRKSTNGFNPSDKVVTRVARLYYWRDAHRMVQVINRRAKSYNAQSATMARQLADQARLFAEQTVDRRKESERRAIEAAQRARQAENVLQQAQRNLPLAQQNMTAINAEIKQQQNRIVSLQGQLDAGPTDPAQIPALQQQLQDTQDQLARLEAERTAIQAEVTTLQQNIVTGTATVEALRENELEYRESSQREQAKEDRAIDHQFRLETAAANEDPDTYAPGIPDSQDPVAQVSLSVIGEGLIQLRGPLKGVNIIRTMINQMDAPVGQVRIGVHKVQINGEDGGKMEEAAARIDRYIDHSRFLTSQSAQMLRKAVVLVASRRAESVHGIVQFDSVTNQGGYLPNGEVCELPGLNAQPGSQAWRDMKYQDAFFGRDFMDELREMDSEFLRTGNKILSLHSMDTTSLASALFLLSLASNQTRHEIMLEFQRMLQCDLPVQEYENFDASDTKLRYGFKKFQFMADNARFVSFRGFFDDQVVGDHTLNPVQREFIRLAQILKSRLITENELKQRIVERALIEERIGNYEEELAAAKQKEKRAQQELNEAIKKRVDAQKKVAVKLSKAIGLIKSVLNSITESQLSETFSISFYEALNAYRKQRTSQGNESWEAPSEKLFDDKTVEISLDGQRGSVKIEHIKDGTYAMKNYRLVIEDPELKAAWIKEFESGRSILNKKLKLLQQFNLPEHLQDIIDREKGYINKLNEPTSQDKREFFNAENVAILSISPDVINTVIEEIDREIDRKIVEADKILVDLSDPKLNVIQLHQRWTSLQKDVLDYFEPSTLRSTVKALLDPVEAEFRLLLSSEVSARVAAKLAEESRRPLDHKKFLDMLIDETEEKFIELVEGTRSQTSVIDDYVKRIVTALDDDFNTQFYSPAFRQVRETNYSCWAVDFAQIEHTNVLTNNRGFGKVLPQATMEFDLPKRDIVLTEAMQAAQAAYSDYGALIADPNFLALTKMYSGQPASNIFNDNGPTPLVRDVLPGMSSQTDEGLMIQGRTQQPEFASQLEALIPDPAVYKFETGTGFEVRPVIQPDGQSVVFKFNFMDTTNIREPVRADEKHLGRVKRHFIDTDVQLSNFELRRVSIYRVALKAARTSRGVPLLEDIPVAGALFRPLPQAESSLQQNIILSQAVIFPTMFDLMGLRWAPAVADVDVHSLQEQEFVYKNRMKYLKNEVYDYSSTQVDEFLRTQTGERRPDLYRTQEAIPHVHPSGYSGPGINRQDSTLQEGYAPSRTNPYDQGQPRQENRAPLLPALPPTIDLQHQPPVYEAVPLFPGLNNPDDRSTSAVEHQLNRIFSSSSDDEQTFKLSPERSLVSERIVVKQDQAVTTIVSPKKEQSKFFKVINFMDRNEESVDLIPTEVEQSEESRWRFSLPFSRKK